MPLLQHMWGEVPEVGQSGENTCLCAMKSMFRATILLLLALCVMVSSVGLALSEQQCPVTALFQG